MALVGRARFGRSDASRLGRSRDGPRHTGDLGTGTSAPATSPGATAAAASEGYQDGNLEQSVVTSPTEAEPGTELPVLYVTGIEIIHSQTTPPIDIVRVTGLTGSQGWSSPQLVPTYIGKPLDGVLDLQFIATMPLQTEPATGFFPVSAVFPLGEGHAFKGVRVRGSENAIEIDQIPGVQNRTDWGERLPRLRR